MPRRTRLTQTGSVAKSQLHRTRGIGGIQWCRCCRNCNDIREFFGMLVGCSGTGGWVEAFRKRVCKCCRPLFTRYFPPSKFGSNVGCHDWARAITTCKKEEEKWLEKTIRNECNTTPPTHDKNLPFGHGWHSHNEATIAVLFKYSVSLQLLGVFQFKLIQAEEPRLGCCHPAGQAMHDVLGIVF